MPNNGIIKVENEVIKKAMQINNDNMMAKLYKGYAGDDPQDPCDGGGYFEDHQFYDMHNLW
jgi:hypothetical protein